MLACSPSTKKTTLWGTSSNLCVSQTAAEGPTGAVCRLQGPSPLGAQDHHSCADHPRLQSPGGLHQRHHRPHQ
ncbi:hypothetical protein LEMLEM_LOCUS20737 [Lemmus lemmus]